MNKKIIILTLMGMLIGSSSAAAFSIVNADTADTQIQEEQEAFIVPENLTGEQFNTFTNYVPAEVVNVSTEGIVGTPAQLMQAILDENPEYTPFAKAVIN